MPNEKKKQTVLLIGATGHLGCAIIAEFFKRDGPYQLRLFLRSPEKLESLATLSKDFSKLQGFNDYLVGDIRNPDDLQKALEGVDIVIHAAHSHEYWQGGEYLYDVNVQGAENLLAQINKSSSVRRVVLIGSYSAHVAENVPPVEELRQEIQAMSPRGNSSRSKLLVQVLFEQACKENGWELSLVSPPYMIGPYQINPALLTITFHLVLFGPLRFYPPGGVNLVDIRDVANITVDCVEQDQKKVRKELVVGDNVSYQELLKISNEIAGHRNRVWGIPQRLLHHFPKFHLFGDFGRDALIKKKYLDESHDSPRKYTLRESVRGQIEFARKTNLFSSSRDVYRWIYQRYFKKRN